MLAKIGFNRNITREKIMEAEKSKMHEWSYLLSSGLELQSSLLSKREEFSLFEANRSSCGKLDNHSPRADSSLISARLIVRL